jgi:hypothetical protein
MGEFKKPNRCASALLILAGCFGVAFSLLYLFQGYFPEPGVRNDGYDTPTITVFSSALDENGLLTEGWSLSDGYVEDSKIVISSGAVLNSPSCPLAKTKYVVFASEDEVSTSLFSLEGYLEETKVDQGEPSMNGSTYFYRFSFDYYTLTNISLVYSGASPIRLASVDYDYFV